MKRIITYLLVIVALTNCSKVLDIPNLNAYDPSQVWTDPNLASAYIGNIYANVFGNWSTGADAPSDQLSGVVFPAAAVTKTAAPGVLNNWNYFQVRLINQGILSTKGSTFTDAVKNNLLGQFYFLRAYAYFAMVRNYGGVPYLKQPLDRYADSLNLPRNSTKECFDFMVQDLDSAILLLPQRVLASSNDWGRIDGNFALAFKARMLLYKASPQFNPSNPWGNAYWADAYTVTKNAYESLKTQGYSLISDYSQIALSERNAEVVFSVINQFPNKTALWDNGLRPGSLSRGAASSCPTWEMVKAFPMKDGKQYSDPGGAYYKTEAQLLQSYWQNRDPRFEKSIVWNAKLYPVAGTAIGYRQYTPIGVATAQDNYGENPNSSERSENNNRYTGFFVLKNCNLTLTQAQVETQYSVDFIVMRFAEVMLNYAEAANETGHLADALDILKQIRKRAGIEPGTDGNFGIEATTRELMRKAIMDERNVELCFEGFRFNDLRRWRMFSVLNAQKNGVEAIAINADGSEMPLSQARTLAQSYQLTEVNFKYRNQKAPTTGVTINTVPDTYYFAPILQNILDAQTKLEQNKDWGGNFNPTLE